ncbi:hypothetical protein PM082_008778 [Marasmius tenuissimus]|nr:hypothetical protein PM082_008778 [Marasmius tenuissimus]
MYQHTKAHSNSRPELRSTGRTMSTLPSRDNRRTLSFLPSLQGKPVSDRSNQLSMCPEDIEHKNGGVPIRCDNGYASSEAEFNSSTRPLLAPTLSFPTPILNVGASMRVLDETVAHRYEYNPGRFVTLTLVRVMSDIILNPPT